jgi:hypothetical protein
MSLGSQPNVYRRPARTFVLPAPRVPDGLTGASDDITGRSKIIRTIAIKNRQYERGSAANPFCQLDT